jgi:hypothetical protein
VVVDTIRVVERGGGWDVRTIGNGLLGGVVVVVRGVVLVGDMCGVVLVGDMCGVVLDTLVGVVRRVVTVGDL